MCPSLPLISVDELGVGGYLVLAMVAGNASKYFADLRFKQNTVAVPLEKKRSREPRRLVKQLDK